MRKTIFISLPITALAASTASYRALGFEQNPRMSDDASACMAWSESIQLMLVTHAKWRTFTQRPFPPAGTSALMLSLAMDSREAVDAIQRAAAAHGGQADANPPGTSASCTRGTWRTPTATRGPRSGWNRRRRPRTREAIFHR
jgi:uncharacterized protein